MAGKRRPPPRGGLGATGGNQAGMDSADAYIVKAELATSRKDALVLYEQAVVAAERALGPDVFQKDVGRFWTKVETRTYMRAREGLANVLWAAGRREEAVGHLQDMLRLNPNDNQGMRYVLAGYLLFLDRDEDLDRLLRRYPDDGSADWAYARALLSFRLEGDTIASRQLLKKAKKINKHVPDLLLDRQPPPAELPAYYTPGDKSEAHIFISRHLVGWKSTPGAIAWVRAQQKSTTKKKELPTPVGPVGTVKTWLRERLPQEEDVWQADFRLLPMWIRTAKETVRPWMVMVTNQTHDLVLGHEILHEMPQPNFLWDILARTLRHPSAREPHRPAQLQVRPHEHWQSLKPHLEEIGVKLAVVDQLDQIEAMLADLVENIGGKPQTGLLDVPGITAAQVGSYYDAAASFFLQAPWKKVGFESVIKVVCTQYQGGPWYAVLMGQSGLTTGLALYEDIDLLKETLTGTMSDEEGSRQVTATSVIFGEESEIPVPDLEAARMYSWRVARPDAYPEIFHKERGTSLRPPLAWELELMEACLRSIPDFVNRRRQDDTTPETMTVALESGKRHLDLAWVED